MEGFGLPVVEAQFAGCRIICSDIPAFREVGRRGCRFVELAPCAEELFAEAVLLSLSEPRPVPAQLNHLAPGRVAQQYLRLYQLLLASPKTFGVSSGIKEKPSGLSDSTLEDEVPTVARY